MPAMLSTCKGLGLMLSAKETGKEEGREEKLYTPTKLRGSLAAQGLIVEVTQVPASSCQTKSEHLSTQCAIERLLGFEKHDAPTHALAQTNFKATMKKLPDVKGHRFYDFFM